MNSKIATITSVIFIVSVVFSVLSLNQMESHLSGVCIPTMVQGATCPGNNILEAINFHMNGFRLFFSGALSGITALLLLFAAAIFSIFFYNHSQKQLSFFGLIPVKAKNHTTQSLLRWHALHEHTPEN